MAKKLDIEKIPEYTQERGLIMQANTEALIALGVKEWKKRKRSGVAVMTEVEQNEMVRKIEEEMLDG